jgi:glycosyltransferase involved in cell wall biosynthesis
MSVNELYMETTLWVAGLIIAQTLCGLLLCVKKMWAFRSELVVLIMLCAGLIISIALTEAPFYAAILLVVIEAYVSFHALRPLRAAANQQQFALRGGRTQLALSLLAVITVLLWSSHSYTGTLLGWLVVTQLAFAAMFLLHTLSSLNKTKPFIVSKHLSDDELPTLTVAIPARNETTDLTDILESLLENDYPKLEVLVLDDCSQDGTSDIIRAFAHRGVRFLKGDEIDDKWLAKNHAYDQLMEGASGTYILFCGVDVRFERQSLRVLIEGMMETNLQMMCVLPLRPTEFTWRYLLQPMRYWRELAIPRIYKTTPPSLSTCWIANREQLQKMGGFNGFRRTIRPEKFIARSFALKHQYHFVRSSPELGIRSVKSLQAQWQTALRTRYPELKSQPENVLFTTLWQFSLLFGPFVGLAYGIITIDLLIISICATTSILLGLVHGLVFYMTTNQFKISAVLLLPASILMELVVLNYSMWAYEYSQVLWKGRNICLPIMHVHAKLPKLKDLE